MTQQAEQFCGLEALLNRQIVLYQEIEEQMERKQAVLIKGDVHQLSKIDQELIVLAQQLTHTEQQRMAMLTEMGYQDKTLKEVIAAMDPKQAEPLRECRKKLKKSIENVQHANRHSRDLLEMSRKWIGDTVEIIARALIPEASTYTARGEKQSGLGKENLGTVLPSLIEREA